jgi:hypothetical protein
MKPSPALKVSGGTMAEEKKGKKKHLHEIRSRQAEDGTIVHHHTYKANKEDHHTEPERENVATSGDAEEAGQHVADQFAQNAGAQPAADPGATDPAAAAEAGAQPGAAAAQPMA